MNLMSFPPKSNNHNMAVWMIAMMTMLWAIISMCTLHTVLVFANRQIVSFFFR